ncbi:hypothetical protein FBU30_007559 [Linnemannia zychae]|nr:hypothetical protein FBU30_007559 [Linnemannia zychae]
MDISRLPIECLSCIVRHLDGDLTTLFNLLTVNSTFFKITLPVLYRDPYRTLERNEEKRARRRGQYPGSISNSVQAKRLLYLLLLSCRQADDLVPFLLVDWSDPLSPFIGDQPLMACYIDYLGDLNFDRWLSTLKQLLVEYDTQMEQYAIRLFRLLFLNHHKERVERLTIPITHIDPYMALLPHLKNLQRVRFYEDDLEPPPQEPAPAQPVNNEEPAPPVNNEVPPQEPVPEQPVNNEEPPQDAAPPQTLNTEDPPPVDDGVAVPITGGIDIPELVMAPLNEHPALDTVDPVANLNPDPVTGPTPGPVTEPVMEPVAQPTADTNLERVGEVTVTETETATATAESTSAPAPAPPRVPRVRPIPVPTEPLETEEEFTLAISAIDMEYDYNPLVPFEVPSTPVPTEPFDIMGIVCVCGLTIDIDDDDILEAAVSPEAPMEEVEATGGLAALFSEDDNATPTVGQGSAAPIDNSYEPEFEVMTRIFFMPRRSTVNPPFEPEEAMSYLLALVGDPEDVFEPDAGMNDLLLMLGRPEEYEQIWEPEETVEEEEEEEEAEEEVAVAQEEVAVQQEIVNPPVQEEPQPVEETPTEPPRPVFDPTPDGVKFLRAHGELFGPGRAGPGIIEIEPPYNWINPSDGDNITYGSRYVQLLMAQETPTLVNFHAWSRFRHYIKDLPLDGIKHLRGFYEEWPPVDWDQVGLVKQCRNMERFASRVYDPTIFKFAIEELKDREIYQQMCKSGVAGASTSLGGGKSHGGYYGPGEDPIPLRKVNVRSFHDGHLLPALEDICTAFKSTLESIICNLYSSDNPLSLGQFCDMPQLTFLELRHVLANSLVNDASFLRGCVNLKNLRLRDGVVEKTLTNETPLALLAPWNLPCLEELSLMGTLGDLFNYETLASTPKLQSLHLECSMTDLGVAAVNDVYLEHLALPSWNCSPVRSLTLKGYWYMNKSPTLAGQFLQTWFSSVVYLKFGSTTFFDHRSVLDGLYLLPNLRKVFLCRQAISPYDAWFLGLEDASLKSSIEWERKTRHISYQEHRKQVRIKAKEKREEAERKAAQMRAEIEAEAIIEAAAFALSDESEGDTPASDNVTVDLGLPSEVSVDNTNSNLQHHHDKPKVEPIPAFAVDRERCQSVDSAIALEEEQAQAEAKAQADEEARMELLEEKMDLFNSTRCVYVFKGKRFYRQVDTPESVHCSL